MIGVDVVDLARLREALARTPRLKERLFTTAELEYCLSRRDPIPHLAGTLAAKEAVIKTYRLGTLAGWARRIEILREADGAPYAQVGERRCRVSISHDGPVAVAVALADR